MSNANIEYFVLQIIIDDPPTHFRQVENNVAVLNQLLGEFNQVSSGFTVWLGFMNEHALLYTYMYEYNSYSYKYITSTKL